MICERLGVGHLAGLYELYGLETLPRSAHKNARTGNTIELFRAAIPRIEMRGEQLLATPL